MRLFALETYRFGSRSGSPRQRSVTTDAALVGIPTAQRPLAAQSTTGPSGESVLSMVSTSEPTNAPAAAARFLKADRRIMPTFGPTTQLTPWPNHNLRYLVQQLEKLRLKQAIHGTLIPTCTVELELDSAVEQDIAEGLGIHFDESGRERHSADSTEPDYLDAVEQTRSVQHTNPVSTRRFLWLSAASARFKFKPAAAASYFPNDPVSLPSPGSMFAQFGFDRDLDNIVPVPIVVRTPGAHAQEPIFKKHSSILNLPPSPDSVSPETQPSDASSPPTPFDFVVSDLLLEEPTPFDLDAGALE